MVEMQIRPQGLLASTVAIDDRCKVIILYVSMHEISTCMKNFLLTCEINKTLPLIPKKCMRHHVNS